MNAQRGFVLAGYALVAGGVALALTAGAAYWMYRDAQAMRADLATAAANQATTEAALAEQRIAYTEIAQRAAANERLLADRNKKLRWAWAEYSKLQGQLSEASHATLDAEAWAREPVPDPIARIVFAADPVPARGAPGVDGHPPAGKSDAPLSDAAKPRTDQSGPGARTPRHAAQSP